MERRHRFENLRDHLKLEGGKYLGLVGIVFVFSVVVGIGWSVHQVIGREAADALSWPIVEAVVVSSRIAEMNASDEVSFATKLSVQAEFSYEVDGESLRGCYARQWLRDDLRDWSELLKPGNRLSIRVSPDHPEMVSLVDHNGVP